MGPIRLSEVARLVGGRVVGDAAVEVSGVAGLREAGPGEISFLARKDYAPLLASTRAAAVIVGRDAPACATPVVVVDDPDAAFSRVVERFTPAPDPLSPGVHPSASVDPSAVLGAGVSVGPCAVVEGGARVGDRTVLRAGSYVGRGARIGSDGMLHPGARLLDGVEAGDRVTVGAGTVVGCDGFGFLSGGPGGLPRRVPQSGTVVLGDDVDLGACVTVARARFGKTVLGRGVKVDCLVQIAHNVRIGDGTIVVSQAGIAGSARVGRGVIMAAQSGVAGHVEVGDGAVLAGRAGATRDVAPGEVVSGFPAGPHADWRRREVLLRRLPALLERLRKAGAPRRKAGAAGGKPKAARRRGGRKA